MSAAEGTRSPAGPAAAQSGAAAPRRHLFVKYALLLVALVGAALLVTSAFDFWFSYQENKAALIRVQQEKAQAASTRIEEFVGEIERQIGWTTHAQWASAPLDQRRQDYFRLLRQVPAITELTELDGEGNAQLRISRLRMDVVGSGEDLSQTPAFIEAKAHRLWFSPVYFRKQSEPYMTMAVAREGKNAGVTIAEINLKLIWDVVTALKIGQGGYAYVVDAGGRLIAHPDISLVLRDTDLAKLPQVAAALHPAAGSPSATAAHNLAGRSVLTAHAAIAPLGWSVFVEVPLREAFAPLYGAALRTALLLLVALVAAALVALVLARRMTGPIRAIAAGAARLGAGELDRRIDIRTGDELETLAGQFNRMADDLQRSYAELEQRVTDRTAELSEALDQQTATAEVLGVINSSPGDLAPVFDAMLEKAIGLCDAAAGTMLRRDGERFSAVAVRGASPAYADFLARGPFTMPSDSSTERVGGGEPFVHFPDVAAEAHARQGVLRTLTELSGARTFLTVPLRKDGALLGVFSIYRLEVRPFSDKQIALVQNFAAQAVIAIENARLITETREALEQQTATAEVLQVINASPGDLAPVFDAILEKANHLCETAFGVLWTFDGADYFPAAIRGPQAFIDAIKNKLRPPGNAGTLYRHSAGEHLVHIEDMAAETGVYEVNSNRRVFVDLGGARSALSVALRKDGAPFGALQVYRQEVRPFLDKQIALLQNFAAQAVIAMENARLITETREALDQQTATAEVLQVINSSPGDLAPVFDAILEKAHSLCGVARGSLELYDGQNFRAVATHGLADSFADRLRQGYPASANPATRPLMEGQAFTHILDRTQHEFPFPRAAIDPATAGTLLCVALRRDDKLLGMIAASRQEVRPFTDKQIALLQNFAAQAVIAMENARLITETREALEQQTATAEVLGVINASPGDLAPVFDAMLEKAMELCEAAFGTLHTRDGEFARLVASRNVPQPFADFLNRQPVRLKTILGPALLDGSVLHITDVAAGEGYLRRVPLNVAGVELAGFRTLLAVPLLKDGGVVGLFVIYRQEVRPFSERQIALLQNFAAQAVIAMENARLITETREALEQQTATAEVLGVINSSPGDLTPVFGAMLEKAMRLCEAAFGVMFTVAGDHIRIVAERDVPEPLSKYLLDNPPEIGPDTFLGRAVRERRLLHTADTLAAESYLAGVPLAVKTAELGHARAMLHAPLLKDDAVLGVFAIFRQEARAFSDKQIALVQNFAAQAVIAMENARLITETREALEQQTATAEVLGVINSSPGDLGPVFDRMVERAARLCEADEAALRTFDGELLHLEAVHGSDPDVVERLRQLGPTPAFGLYEPFARGERVAHYTDVRETKIFREDPVVRARLELRGIRTWLAVGLHKDAALLGVILVHRHTVRPFSDKQIALLQNFAAQAVIAMENARLITETREALEQQTATAEVLGVINSSPGDLAPVFDAMLEKATRLCDAPSGIFWTVDGEFSRAVALHGVPPAYADYVREPLRMDAATGLYRVQHGQAFVATVDMADEEPYRAGHPHRRAIVDLGRARSAVRVPLIKDGTPLGVFVLYRQEVRPFTDKQIALLQNFAAQAVIAMENARLIAETREALEQQTATAEVLQVINSSPGDLAPVFDAMLEKAMRLCEAAHGHLVTFDGEVFNRGAAKGDPRFTEWWLQRGPMHPPEDSPLGRVVRGDKLVHLADAKTDDVYREIPPYREFIDNGGIRTLAAVALRKDDALLGAILVYRQEVRPFSEKQIALLQNFAAQAVIAMENARLITETREALEQQTATAEVLQVINSSPGDLAPVFDAILEKAHDLCGAVYGGLVIRNGEEFRVVAARGESRFVEAWRQLGPVRPPEGGHLARLVRGERIVHLADARADDVFRNAPPQFQHLVEVGGTRTLLIVPLRRNAELLGVITAFRTEVRPFSGKEIALLENFAAQAVIAMENARLLTETRERTRDLQESLEYQTATSDVLKVISQSTFDLTPVLDFVCETAVRLCGVRWGNIWRLEDGVYRWASGFGVQGAYLELQQNARIPPGRETLVGRVALTRDIVHILDGMLDPDYGAKDDLRLVGCHTMLGVPLLREGAVVGVICMGKTKIEAVTEKQIELVRTFADQAVIAIENARLLNELRARTDELGRSVEELRALGEVGQAVSSTLDLRAVLSTVLNRSVALAGAEAGVIFRYRPAEHAFRFVEAVGYTDAMVRDVRALDVAEGATGMGEAIARRTPLQIPDLRERMPNPLREQALAAGYRSVLIVPLVGADRILGAIILQRRATGEFSEATVRLMQTIAAQSVLAIQNARLFNEIAEKSEQLAEASRHKSQFLANMSHELRTPLNAILGYTELMADGIYGELAPRAAGVLERVQNNGKHLLALINDVLDLAKIEAGQLVFTLEDYALPDVVRSVVSATEGLANSKGLKFAADIAAGLPMGHGDARRLSQVLLNLAGNAIKFTDAGEVAIAAAAEDGNFVLTVRDTGPGIAPADHDKIFGEFQQVDNSNTRKKGGTGLGLAISKRMVEMQGGTITVASELGRGATFRVTLPIRVESVAEEFGGEAIAAPNGAGAGELMGAAQ